MSSTIFILGKTPDLSIAELKSRYPGAKITVEGENFVVMDIKKDVDQQEFDQLGGCIKAAKVVDTTTKDKLVERLAEALGSHYSGSKLDYGVSVYGFSEKQLRFILLKLKKELRKNDVKSRFINNDFKNISAAQYKSIKKKGIEMMVVREGGRFLIGEVTGVQDIDAYSKRDYDKPFRSMKMGMLPPKLAQILINLTGVDGKIWDPFCGSGTLIMEGLLMGRDMNGSDIESKHIEGAKKNIEWLKREFDVSAKAELLVHDALEPIGGDYDAIAFEGDLGIPHDRDVKIQVLDRIIADLNSLYIRFFENLKAMNCTVPVVAAIPFFRLQNGQERDLHKAIRVIHDMGFKKTLHLKYSRADQAVGRDIYRFLLK